MLGGLISGVVFGILAVLAGVLNKKREKKREQRKNEEEARRVALGIVICPKCRAELPPTAVSCPLCGWDSAGQ